MRDTTYFQSRCLGVIYKDAHYFGKRKKRDLSDFERGVSKEHRGFKLCVRVSQSDLNPIEHLWEILECPLRLRLHQHQQNMI